MSMITVEMARYYAVTFLIFALLFKGSLETGGGAGGGGKSPGGGGASPGGGGASPGGGGASPGDGGGSSGQSYAGLADNGVLDIEVSYSTGDENAKDCFTKLVSSSNLDQIKSCKVFKWSFKPCRKSKIEGGKLVCDGGDCKADEFHACVAKKLSGDSLTLGKFISCYFTNWDPKTKAKDDPTSVLHTCASSNGLNADEMETCAKDPNQGAKFCDEFFKELNNEKITITPAFKVGKTFNEALSTDIAHKWPKTLCKVLADNKLQCDKAC